MPNWTVTLEASQWMKIQKELEYSNPKIVKLIQNNIKVDQDA